MRLIARFVSPVTLALIAVAAWLAPANADASFVFHPQGGGFAVWMPGSPTHQHQSQTTSGISAESDLYGLTAGGQMYFVGVTTYGSHVNVPAELALDRDNFDHAVAATPTSQRDIDSNGIAGIEVISQNSTRRFHALWYSDGYRAWGVVVAMPLGSSDDAPATHFLSSFELTASSS